MGFNPANDGTVIRIPIPPLTEERRKELVKIVKKQSEDYKISIRNIRRDFLDQIKNLEKFDKILFNKISYPILILPFLSRSSEIIGKKISIKFNKIEFLINLNVSILSNLSDQSLPEVAENIEINLLENKDNFTEQEWKNLYKLSEETFVEETDSLKKGAAGAGLTDND